MKKQVDKTPNVSETVPIVNDQQKEDLKNLKEKQNLDEESLYYARLFMEE